MTDWLIVVGLVSAVGAGLYLVLHYTPRKKDR